MSYMICEKCGEPNGMVNNLLFQCRCVRTKIAMHSELAPAEPPASEPPSDTATMSVQDLGRLLCTARDEIESLWAEYEEHVCSCDPKFKCFFHEHLDKSIEVAEASGYKGLLAKFVAAERIAYLEGVEDSPEHVRQAALAHPERKEADEIIEACAGLLDNWEGACWKYLAAKEIRVLKGKFTLAGKEADELRERLQVMILDHREHMERGLQTISLSQVIAALEAALGERRE
jgi:hypothetical protein